MPGIFYPWRAGSTSVSKTVCNSFWGHTWPWQEAFTSGLTKHYCLSYVPCSWSSCTHWQKEKGITTICDTFLLSSFSDSFSWIQVISPHPPAILAEITVFHSTSTFHLPGTCFLSGSEAFGGWGSAPKPSLQQGFLVEMYFLLHIKVHWKHTNLNPSGVIYIRKYIYQFL